MISPTQWIVSSPQPPSRSKLLTRISTMIGGWGMDRGILSREWRRKWGWVITQPAPICLVSHICPKIPATPPPTPNNIPTTATIPTISIRQWWFRSTWYGLGGGGVGLCFTTTKQIPHLPQTIIKPPQTSAPSLNSDRFLTDDHITMTIPKQNSSILDKKGGIWTKCDALYSKPHHRLNPIPYLSP